MRASLLAVGCLSLLAPLADAQIVEVARPPAPATLRAKPADSVAQLKSPAAAVCAKNKNVAAVERGFVDYFSSGATQATVQLIRLCLGEPGRFRLPLYFLAGSPGKVSGGNTMNAATLGSILNPLGGFLNAAVNDSYEIWPRNPAYQYTSFQLAYQAAAKYLNGHDTTNTTGVPAMIGYADLGLRYQTGATNLDDVDPSKVGIAWIQVKFGANIAGSTQFKRLFGADAGQILQVVSVDGGVAIDSRLNLKISYETTVKHLRNLDKDQLKLAFDFSPGK